MPKTCYVIGGGESLSGFDFNVLAQKDVIAINKSILDVPFAKYFVSMDYTFIDKKINKDLFKLFPAYKFFVVAVNNKYIKCLNNQYIDTRNNYIYDLSLFDTVIVSSQDTGAGSSMNEFVHGCCSGYCGLQLALVLGYTEIYLLGIDMIATAQTHYHRGYKDNLGYFKNKLRFYYPYFVQGLEEIKSKFPSINVYSCSEKSPLNKIIKYKALEEIK